MGPTMPRILLADDERTLRLILGRTLRARGYAVAEAASGAATLDAITAEPPALLLLDVQLPDMTGWEVLRRLAAAGSLAVPTIVLSSAAPDPADLAARHGVTFLPKPFPLDTLLQLVADTLAVGEAADVSRRAAEQPPETSRAQGGRSDWPADAARELHRVCALVAKSAGGVPHADLLVCSTRSTRPSAADWVAVRRLAGDLAATYGVRVAPARTADGVAFRVAPAPPPHSQIERKQNRWDSIGAWVRRRWWERPRQGR